MFFTLSPVSVTIVSDSTEANMEAKVSIIARVPEGDGYRLVTLEKKRGSYVKPDNAISYYLRYTDATTGKRKDGVPAGEDFSRAVVLALNTANQQNALRNGHAAPAIPIQVSSDRLTVRDAVKQWIDSFVVRLERWRHKDDNGLAPSSIAAYTKTGNDFADYCDKAGVLFMPRTDKTGEQGTDEVNADMLIEYQSYLRKNLDQRHKQNGDTKDRQGSIITRFCNLGIFFSYFRLFISERPRTNDGRGILRRNDMPRGNAAKKRREAKAKQTSTVIIYSDEEIQAMLKAADVDESDLIKFLLETGVRDKEAAHVEWSDIENGFLNLKDKPKYEWRLKDKENRSIPVNPKLMLRLKTRKARQEKAAKADGQDAPILIFPNSLNRPNLALDETVQRVVAKAKKDGFKWGTKSEVTMHKFRKNFATLMHRAGLDITTVAELLGHSDIETTKLYIAIDTQKAVDVSKIAFQAFGD